MTSPFDLIDDARTKLNEIEDSLIGLAHEHRSKAHNVEVTLNSLRSFRDALYTLDHSFDETGK